MPPDRRPSLAGSISSPTGGHSSLHSNGAGQEDEHSASPSAEPEGSKGKRKHTRGIGRGRVSPPSPSSALCTGADRASPVTGLPHLPQTQSQVRAAKSTVVSSTEMLTHRLSQV